MRKALFAFLCVLAACPATATTQGKKIVSYGWGCPDTAYVRQHIKELEKTPFDGIVISVTGAKEGTGADTLGWRCFTNKRFQLVDYQHAIGDLKAAKSARLTDNFIQVVSMPADIDWFDRDWFAAAHNAACLARVAKKGGCKGIMFDPEMYGKNLPWSYTYWHETRGSRRTFQEYQARTRECGREFIRAVNKEFPDITILCLFGMSAPYLQCRVLNKADIATIDYALLGSFYDGICEAATPGTTLVDGYEWSYGYRTHDEFAKARKLILTDAQTLSQNPMAFKQHVRAGFGVWVDNNSGTIPWNAKDYSKNYFTPAGFRASINYAMNMADRYVWVYNQGVMWWGKSKPAPKEYVDALHLARLGPAPERSKARL